MDLSRRDFLGVTATAAITSLQPATAGSGDPLGVRKDFPALRDLTFLNTAYTGLIPQAVVEAAREWTSTRASRGYTVGEMLGKSDDVRRLYAELFGAGEDEIAFLSSTSEGENLVVNSIDFKAAARSRRRPEPANARARGGSFFNNEADVDRMLDAATKLSAS